MENGTLRTDAVVSAIHAAIHTKLDLYADRVATAEATRQELRVLERSLAAAETTIRELAAFVGGHYPQQTDDRIAELQQEAKSRHEDF